LESLRESPSLSKKQLRAQSFNSPRKVPKTKFGRHTAGTTGEPTHVSLNRSELARMLGVRDYCFRHYGLKLGQREARLWGRPESGIKSWIRNFVMNRRVFYPLGPQAEQEMADLINWRPDYLYGYSSLLLEAAKVLDRMDVEFWAPVCVVCTAESILPAQKAFISQVFQAPVAEEYGSTEFDVIAFECSRGHRHLVNPWLLVEEGDDNGVISDVSRISQNMIKYELGDSFTVKRSACRILGSEIFIEELYGRTIDGFFFVNENEKIHEIFLSRLFNKYFHENNDIFSFQMRQNEYSSIEVVIDKQPIKGVKHLRSFLEIGVANIAHSGINVQIYVEKNPEVGQKRNYFIQNMSVTE